MQKKDILSCSLLIGALFIPTCAFGYGEDGSIPEEARAIHLLTNEARCNTKEALANCGSMCSEKLSCHKESMPPLYWDTGLYHAAQFYSVLLSEAKCMQHDTPCTLVSTLGQDFPDKCNGSASCACKEGKATCKSKGTSTWDRIKMFAKNASGENLASAIGALGTFNLWLLEDGKGDGCEFTMNNGHRMNILNSSHRAVGIGYYGSISTQDFAGSSAEKSPISAGSHYKDQKTLWFKLHYYAQTAIDKAVVSVNGNCTDLEKTRGTPTNSVWGTSGIETPADCTPYFFEVKDANGTISRYPTEGSLLFHCDKSWGDQTLASCLDITEPPEDKTEPPEDKTEPPEDKTEPGDNTEPPEDKTEPPEDKTEPPEDKTEPPKDTDPADDDKTKPTTDTPKPTNKPDSEDDPNANDDDEDESGSSDSNCSANPLSAPSPLTFGFIGLAFGLLLRLRRRNIRHF